MIIATKTYFLDSHLRVCSALESYVIEINIYKSYIRIIMYNIRLHKKWLSVDDSIYLQHIADDSYAPHVCGKVNWFIVNHFRCHELWGSKQHP